MTEDFHEPWLQGVFGLTSTSGQRRARWLTPEGRAALDAALDLARSGGSWQVVLEDLPFVEETFEIDDPSTSQRDLRNAPLDGCDLRGADLRGAFLDEASVKRARLSGADLSGAHVSRADFTEADLAGADFSHVAGRAIFRAARLDGVRFTSATVPGSDFRDAGLIGTDFTEAVLAACDFTGADVSQSITVGARFGGRGQAGPQRDVTDSTSDASAVKPLFGLLGAESTPEQRRLRWTTVEGRAALDEAVRIARSGGAWQMALVGLPHVEEASEGSGVSPGGRDLRGAPLEGVDLSGADLRGALMHEASLRDARLAGADLRYTKIFDADYDGADLTNADLSFVRARATFRGAVMSQAKLIGAALQGCDFRESSLIGADFSEATVLYCEFSEDGLSRAVTINTFFGSQRQEMPRFHKPSQ